MNDPTQNGCEDDGTGNPGACPMPKTIDKKSPARGMEPEIVTVAVACDRVLAVSCGENNGDCFLYDVTDLPSPPILMKVFNLSPISETYAPGPAYKARTLGDLDPEATFFAPAEKSPTGVAGMFFGGAHSGTMSWWEFECTSPVDAIERTYGSAIKDTSGNNNNNDKKEYDGVEEVNTSVVLGSTTKNGGSDLSQGAIAGIVIASLALVAFIVFIIVMKTKKGEQSTIILDGTQIKEENTV
jgi:hypothetical protein